MVRMMILPAVLFWDDHHPALPRRQASGRFVCDDRSGAGAFADLETSRPLGLLLRAVAFSQADAVGEDDAEQQNDSGQGKRQLPAAAGEIDGGADDHRRDRAGERHAGEGCRARGRGMPGRDLHADDPERRIRQLREEERGSEAYGTDGDAGIEQEPGGGRHEPCLLYTSRCV